MPLIIPAGFGLAQFELEGPGLRFPATVTMGLDDNASGTVDDKAALAHDAFGDSFLSNMNSSVSLMRTILKLGPNDTGAFGTFSLERPGTVGGTGSSSAVAFLIRKTTALGGHRHRGRMYLPGVTEADVGSDGVVSAGRVTNLQAGCVQFMTQLTAANLLPVILHGESTAEEPTPVPAPTPITGLSAQNVVATQRERQRR